MPSVTVRGTSERLGNDLWNVLARNVEETRSFREDHPIELLKLTERRTLE